MLRVFENRVLKWIVEHKRNEVTGKCTELHNEELYGHSSTNIIHVIKSSKMRLVAHVARVGRIRFIESLVK
jgi:hypothetical protein